MVEPLIKNDAVVLGILFIILAFVFISSNSQNRWFLKFYKYVPSLLLCYFIPSILNSMGIISGDHSNLYFVASRYLLPASLVLLTIGIDLPEIIKLGPKAIIMFLSGTLGIIIGGPFSIIFISYLFPNLIDGLEIDLVWRGLTTIAGSWIGGGANQAAMKEIFLVDDAIFSTMIAVDVIVANIWMAFLLYGSGVHEKIDRILNADSSSIDDLRKKIETYRSQILKVPDFVDTVKVISVAFTLTGIAHFGSDLIVPYIEINAPELAKFSLTSNFFWIIVISTSLALILSFTNIRNLEGVGASRYGSLFLYILVATIGMKMNIMAIFDNPGFFLIGIVWMSFHAIFLIIVAKFIKAPLFFLAVGSQANVGGAASAPIVASAFHPSLAPVGVLLAVLGYAVGTYGAWFCGVLMQISF